VLCATTLRVTIDPAALVWAWGCEMINEGVTDNRVSELAARPNALLAATQ
jgi:hypothetical protein